jgi:uncharacterized protein
MRCPVDDAPLREVTRRGVKIDLCAECRGVWLDRGELDHLIEASDGEEDDGERRDERREPARAARSDDDDRDRRPAPRSRDDDDDRDRPSGSRSRDDDDRYRASGTAKKKKPLSWLSEMLEFGE